MNISVRGIYTTALTHLLAVDGDQDVVQASEPIRERFESGFPAEPAAVHVATTRDRQGVGVEGDREGVAAVADALRAVGVDTLTWTDPTPTGAVFDARVTGTRGAGAVLDLGVGEGYLPFDRVDDYVETGDSLRVQVRAGAPHWDDDDPLCDPGVEVGNGLARLVRGGSVGETSLDLASLLPTDPREGWAVRWNERADDADLDALGTTLEDLNERAERIDRALPDAVGDPGRLTDDRATTWAWFGRESRFALDGHRRAAAATMPGHHRCKAATHEASAAVDFAEAVCGGASDAEFPFGALTRQFGPRVGDRVALGHGKPDGRLIVLGKGEVTEFDPEGGITVERSMSPGGTYDALGVERRAGDVATTKLTEGRWWYPTVYRGRDGDRRGTYVNVCTPVELFPEVARYVDLHVDVVKHADGTVERVDDDELDEAVAAGEVPEPLAERARRVATAVENAMRE
jgi:hypothetical protein